MRFWTTKHKGHLVGGEGGGGGDRKSLSVFKWVTVKRRAPPPSSARM